MILTPTLNNALQSGSASGSTLDAATIAAIADAVWDEPQSGHTINNSFGDRVDDIADMLVNNATVTNEVDGSRTITIFEGDGTTIKRQVNISADNLTRTRVV